jgi:hypothetical protein
VRFITEREKEIVLAAFSDLEKLLNEYRGAVMLLTFGDHEAVNDSRKQTTQLRMKELREEITALGTHIEIKEKVVLNT